MKDTTNRIKKYSKIRTDIINRALKSMIIKKQPSYKDKYYFFLEKIDRDIDLTVISENGKKEYKDIIGIISVDYLLYDGGKDLIFINMGNIGYRSDLVEISTDSYDILKEILDYYANVNLKVYT